MGRPSKYSQDLADKICEQVANGISVREICQSEDMPTTRTVFNWLAVKEDFFHQYAKAKEAGMEHLAEELLEIADDGKNDWMERQGNAEEGSAYYVNGEAIARSRLRVDTRKWIMSKLMPKKYGDKLVAEVGGPDGGPLKVSIIERVIVDGNDRAKD